MELDQFVKSSSLTPYVQLQSCLQSVHLIFQTPHHAITKFTRTLLSQ